MPFTFRFSRNDALLAVFEEQDDAPGGRRLVAGYTDPGLTVRELDELRADAMHRWLHPVEVPEDWLDE